MRMMPVSVEELSKRKTYYGWLVAARGPNFVFYSYRHDRLNWGDINVKPSKKGGFIVFVAVSKAGKRFRHREVVDSFRDGSRVAQRFLKKYSW